MVETEKPDPRKVTSIVTGILEVSASLAVKKTIFGGPKPTYPQMAWIYGFCDAFGQRSQMGQIETIAMMGHVCQNLFGPKQAEKIAKIIEDPEVYLSHIMSGGRAAYAFLDNEEPPLMPPE